jgi:hypothetical protein
MQNVVFDICRISRRQLEPEFVLRADMLSIALLFQVQDRDPSRNISL